jgi:hypothetical protein
VSIARCHVLASRDAEPGKAVAAKLREIVGAFERAAAKLEA